MTTTSRDFVGYGSRPPLIEWPNGARLALSIVVNYEEGAELSVADGDPTPEIRGEIPRPFHDSRRDLANESYYEYGSRVGVWRLLDMFDRHQVPTTFFVCGRALERNLDAAQAITAAGHEPCSHGYRWIQPSEFTREQERADIDRAVRSIESTTGERPVGWYCRYGPSPNTRELLVEEGGFLYDSDTYNDDLPYYVSVQQKSFLVIPYTLDVNDIKFWVTPGFGGPSDFEDYLRSTFDFLRREAQHRPQFMSLGLHLRIAGRPGRAACVDRFLTYAKQFPDVWFARRRDVAKWWQEHAVPPGPETPTSRTHGLAS